MADKIAPTVKAPGTFTNIHITDIVSYRLPAAGWVSILHRVSGALLFVLLPLAVWLFDTSVTSEMSFERFRAAFLSGIGFVPGWFIKLLVLGLIWGYITHFIAGVRHLWMDVTHSVSKQQGAMSANVTLVLSILLTLICAAKLFGLY
jgi:succinate dehydrogenase / fumarate reductase, cytochrome b subunit